MESNTLLGTNISPDKCQVWRWFSFSARWDMLIPWRKILSISWLISSSILDQLGAPADALGPWPPKVMSDRVWLLSARKPGFVGRCGQWWRLRKNWVEKLGSQKIGHVYIYIYLYYILYMYIYIYVDYRIQLIYSLSLHHFVKCICSSLSIHHGIGMSICGGSNAEGSMSSRDLWYIYFIQASKSRKSKWVVVFFCFLGLCAKEICLIHKRSVIEPKLWSRPHDETHCM